MNKFKKNLKVDEGIKPCDEDNIRNIDEKISANIAKLLFEMSRNAIDINERTQILNRMLSINNLFKEGFDKQIEKLIKPEKEEKEQ